MIELRRAGVRKENQVKSCDHGLRQHIRAAVRCQYEIANRVAVNGMQASEVVGMMIIISELWEHGH
jgi:hypothetical protein